MPREYSRTLRINTQLQRELSDVIRDELTDPRIGNVTVTQVTVSPDVRNARVMVSMLDTDAALAEAVKALNGANGRLRHLLSDRMRIRYVPQLHFSADVALREGDRIGGLIRAAREQDLQSPAQDTPIAPDEDPASV
ncbi:MAG: 30S ribosome-binding factor RbfA [Nevskia sp.]|nr:30S ribosome-binding factor RbfA [Nevskia sp.]MCK9386226.1 30S ribosome-binding factor RbfA [Nevskia sp.]